MDLRIVRSCRKSISASYRHVTKDNGPKTAKIKRNEATSVKLKINEVLASFLVVNTNLCKI